MLTDCYIKTSSDQGKKSHNIYLSSCKTQLYKSLPTNTQKLTLTLRQCQHLPRPH